MIDLYYWTTPNGHKITEPDRVFRRLLILEGWSHDQAYTPVFS
jgi:hypothetical protein